MFSSTVNNTQIPTRHTAWIHQIILLHHLPQLPRPLTPDRGRPPSYQDSGGVLPGDGGVSGMA